MSRVLPNTVVPATYEQMLIECRYRPRFILIALTSHGDISFIYHGLAELDSILVACTEAANRSGVEDPDVYVTAWRNLRVSFVKADEWQR